MSTGDPARPPPLPSRRGRPRTAVTDAEDRAVLLEHARRLLEQEGASALSMRRVAQEVKTSYQVVYTLFGGKAELLAALFCDGFQQLEARCRALPAADSPADTFVKLAGVYRRFALEHPHLYALMFGRGVPDFDPDPESRRIARRSFDVVREAARRVLDASDGGQSLFQDEQELARAAWSATHGHVVFELDSWFGRDPGSAARLEKTVTALAEAALGSAGKKG